MEGEVWENTATMEMPLLEDINDNGLFVISCANSDDGERLPSPVGTVEIEGTVTNLSLTQGHQST